MLQPPHRRRSSALGSMAESASGAVRRREESFARSAGEGMDLVKDQDEDHDEDNRQPLKEEVDREPRRNPVKLRGRGGFSHPRASVQGRGKRVSTALDPLKSATAASTTTADPVDSLATSMSALQFIPHSVRMARGRGGGRGG